MEPERHIEKLLRAFARKRRSVPGDAFKLHSSARRRLQVVVEQRFKEADEPESVSLWQFFRQQWAFVAIFGLALFLGASLFVPALGKAKSRALSVAAATNLKQIGAAAQMAAAENNGRLPATLETLTNGYLSGETLKDPRTGQPFTYAAGGEMLEDLRSNSVLAYSAEDRKRRAVLLADGSVQMMNADQFTAADRSGLIQRGRKAEVALNAPAAAVAAAALPPAASVADKMDLAASKDFGLAKAAPKQAFQTRETVTGTALAANNANVQRFNQAPAKTPALPVLVAFDLQVDGNNVAVVDRDGSVYNGVLETNAMAATNLAATVQDDARNVGGVGAAQNQSLNQNAFFRVTGLNRTLQQSVVFTGNLSPLPAAAVNQNASRASGFGGNASSVFANQRITGTVTLDGTNRLEIEALPVTP